MNIHDEFPGAYFKAAEVVGKKLTLTIERVEKEEMNDGKYKPVVYFEEDDRGLVLNKTNRGEMSDRFGPETDGWIGKSITLVTTKVQGMTGKRVDSICLADQPASEALDDEIPEHAGGKPRKQFA